MHALRAGTVLRKVHFQARRLGRLSSEDGAGAEPWMQQTSPTRDDLGKRIPDPNSGSTKVGCALCV